VSRPTTGGRPRPDRRGAGADGAARRERLPGLGGDQVEGRRAVRELLAAGRRPVRAVWLAEGLDPSPVLDEIEALALRRRVPVETVTRGRLDAAAKTDAPQGVLARARPVEPVPLEALCEVPAPFLLVAAGVTDPRNLGSLLRSAECAGVTGVVLPRHRAAHLSPTVAKVAAGAIEHLGFALVGGVPAALATLADLGVPTVGLAAEARRSLYEVDVAGGPVALVVGGEERGLAPLARKRCDEVVAIPQHGALESLNVGVAAAVACFEIARRRAGGGAGGEGAGRPLRRTKSVGRLSG
jgi:23S rRNA (guanosine2251-2'-O)-methyltransferase